MALFYILIILLQRQENILFTVSEDTQIFRPNKPVLEFVTKDLPSLKKVFTNGQRVWSLVDALSKTGPPTEQLISTNFFVVYATSPKVNRYYEWSKQKEVPLFRMPLWTKDQLVKG